MHPDTGELLRAQPLVHLQIKEVRDRRIVELDRDAGTGLAQQHQILQVEQVIRHADREPADLGVSRVPQEQELGPGRRAEPQRRGRWQLV